MNNCRGFSEKVKSVVKQRVRKLDSTPILTIIQVGDNPSSNSYVKGKIQDCKEVGIFANHRTFPESITTDDLLEQIAISLQFCAGLIVQLPLPKHINVRRVQDFINAQKDVDGFNRISYFDPCTPMGVIQYLTYEGFDFEGKVACVIGRSDIVGKPLARMLLNKNMTVITCHSKTPKETMKQMIESADIVFTAISPIETFDEDWFFSFNGRHIIDIGLGMNKDGKLRGNIKKEVRDRLIEENPNKIIVSGLGGVGLLTRMALLENTLFAAELEEEKKK